MTVKDLKVLLSKVSDDSLIVIEGSDHSFTKAAVTSTQAFLDTKYHVLAEYYGPEYDTGEPGKVVPVLLVH